MLLISGTVAAVEPAKRDGTGPWARLIIGSARRVNDLVLIRKDTVAELKIAAGSVVELPVTAMVDTNAEGRPTRNITYFHADRQGEPVDAA